MRLPVIFDLDAKRSATQVIRLYLFLAAVMAAAGYLEITDIEIPYLGLVLGIPAVVGVPLCLIAAYQQYRKSKRVADGRPES